MTRLQRPRRASASGARSRERQLLASATLRMQRACGAGSIHPARARAARCAAAHGRTDCICWAVLRTVGGARARSINIKQKTSVSVCVCGCVPVVLRLVCSEGVLQADPLRMSTSGSSKDGPKLDRLGSGARRESAPGSDSGDFPSLSPRFGPWSRFCKSRHDLAHRLRTSKVGSGGPSRSQSNWSPSKSKR